jgi:hypothetical protein
MAVSTVRPYTYHAATIPSQSSHAFVLFLPFELGAPAEVHVL